MAGYIIISFDDPDFETKLVESFKSDGVVVISDVMTKSECDNHVDNIVGTVENLGTGVKRGKCEETWLDDRLPPQTRLGLFQCGFSNIETVWKIRSDERILKIFTILYSSLRQKELKTYDDFIVSGDGINLRPNGIDDYKTVGADWPHIDQTDRSDVYKCIQGQMVLTNTTASFVASPKSHTIYENIMDYYEIPPTEKSNWFRILNTKDKTIGEVKSMVEKAGGSWQIPILSSAGSFIVWSSSTIHSARLPVKKEKKDKNDIWLGWRSVVYVCYRPKDELTEDEIKTRQTAFEENRVTNHWGTKIFNKNPKGPTNRNAVKRDTVVHPTIREIMDNPKVIYDKNIVMPNLNDNCRKLLGYE